MDVVIGILLTLVGATLLYLGWALTRAVAYNRMAIVALAKQSTRHTEVLNELARDQHHANLLAEIDSEDMPSA